MKKKKRGRPRLTPSCERRMENATHSARRRDKSVAHIRGEGATSGDAVERRSWRKKRQMTQMKRVEKVGRAHPGAPPPHNQRICTSSERAALCLLQRRPAVEPFLLFRKIHLNSRLPPDLFSPSRALLNKRSGRRAAAGASVPCRASPGLRKQAPGTTARVESDRRSSRYWSAALAHSVPSAEGCDPEGNKRTEEEEVGAGVADRKGRAWGS